MCQLLFPLHLLPSRISQVSPLPVWICLLGLTAQAQSWDCPLLQGFIFLKFLFCALFSFGLIWINYTYQCAPVWMLRHIHTAHIIKASLSSSFFPSTHPSSLGSTLPLRLFENIHIWERRCGTCVSQLGLFRVAACLPIPATVSKKFIL